MTKLLMAVLLVHVAAALKRQMDGDGVFMAFVSKINLVTGDPANVFLRPASAGTGR